MLSYLWFLKDNLVDILVGVEFVDHSFYEGGIREVSFFDLLDSNFQGLDGIIYFIFFRLIFKE